MATLLAALGLKNIHNQASQVRNSKLQVRSLEIHLEEVLLELGRVRKIKQRSTTKLGRKKLNRLRVEVLSKF
jgi:hypothetical protein